MTPPVKKFRINNSNSNSKREHKPGCQQILAFQIRSYMLERRSAALWLDSILSCVVLIWSVPPEAAFTLIFSSSPPAFIRSGPGGTSPVCSLNLCHLSTLICRFHRRSDPMLLLCHHKKNKPFWIFLKKNNNRTLKYYFTSLHFGGV